MSKFQESLKNAVQIAIAFLKDQQRPLWQRIAAPLGVLMLLSIVFSCGDDGDSSTGINTPEEAMGFGADEQGTDLGEEATKEEKLLARMPQQEEQSKFDIRDLELDDEQDTDFDALAEREESLANKPNRPKTPFANFSSITPHPVDISEFKDGTIWVANIDSIIELAKGLKISPKTILDADLYDREFNETMSSISNLYLAEDGSIWVGFSKGEVAMHHRYSWQLLTKASEPIRSKIFDITHFADSTFFASRGIWRWEDTYRRAVGAKDMSHLRVSKFLTSSKKELYAAAKNGVWRYNNTDHSWALVWKSQRKDGAVHALAERYNGNLLVGTSNGIIELSTRGVVTDRLLEGEIITSIQEDSKKNLYVGTRQHGLFFWNGSAWFRAAASQGLADRIDTVLLDTTGRLWLTASRNGLLVAAASRARTWLEKFPESLSGEQFTEPKMFPSACDAANNILKGITLSRNIAIEVLDGTSYVFFSGRQVCPKGNGYRRADGTVVIQDGWSLTVFGERTRETIQIPKEFAADENTAILLDSQNRLWMGTSDYGVYLYSNKKWSSFGQREGFFHNRIRRIVEDSKGRIWIASNPLFDRQSRKYSGDPVNVLEGDTWTSFSPKGHFGSWVANDIVELDKDRMLIATQNGFSITHTNGQSINFSAREKIDPIYNYCAVKDGKGIVWFAHQFFGDGISWFDGSSFYHVGKKEGLFAEKIIDIAHDRQGRVWLMRSTGQLAVYPRAYLQQRATKLELPERKQVSLK